MFSFNVFIILAIIVSVFLVFLCLLQNSKKDNASGNVIGGSSFYKTIGVKKTSDILESFTFFFIFLLFFLCILSYTKIRKVSENSSPNLNIAKMNKKNKTLNKNKNNSSKDDNKNIKIEDKKDNKIEDKKNI